MLRLHQYDRVLPYLRNALNNGSKNDVEILYGFSLSAFRNYVSYKDEAKIVRLNTVNSKQSHYEQSDKLAKVKQDLSEGIAYLKKIRLMQPKYIAGLKLLGEICMKGNLKVAYNFD